MPRELIDRSVAAADRTLDILEAFGRNGGRIQRLEDLAKEAGLSADVVSSYLISFERHGYVTKVAEGKYQLGTAVLRLGRAYDRTFDISQHIMPILEELSSVTGESASYYVRNNDRRLCLYRVDSRHALRVSVTPGSFLPLDQSASGTVLREFWKGQAHAGPPAKWVRARAVPDKHFASMSAPVFGIDGELAGALTVSGPLSRFNPVRDAAACKKLLAAAQRLSAKLGAPAPVRHSARR
jgi:DNA-binding IclR family transcriptional regulator